MFKFLLSSILIATGVLAQDSVMIRDFSGGLNTVSSDFAIDNKYARFVHNFDLGRNVGALTRRLGYDSVSAVASNAFDSLTYPFGCYLPDGRQLMFATGDKYNQSYAEVFSTDYNTKSFSATTNIASYWGMKYHTTYAMQNGIIFIANGQNRMVAYDALGGKFSPYYPNPFGDGPSSGVSYSRPIPPYSPGEIEVYPLEDTTGQGILYGDYVWGIVIQDSGATANHRVGYLTPKMRIDSGRAMIRGLRSFFVADSVKSTDTATYVKLYRTKVNPGPITQFTVLYKTGDSIKFPGGADPIIDDTPDGSLVVADSVMPSQFKKNGPSDPRRPGQPQIQSRTFYATAPDSGISRGTMGTHILRWSWACTFVDTSFNAESDTGSHIEADAGTVFSNDSSWTTLKKTNLFLPQPNSNYKHMGVNIYRAPIFAIVDSTLPAGWTVEQIDSLQNFIDILRRLGFNPQGPSDFWRRTIRPDTTIVGAYHLIGHAKPGDTVFVDTFSLDQLFGGEILRQNRPPSGINNLVSYNGRLFGSSGSRLYMTLLDSGSFAQMRFINLNQDDGDEITAIFPTRRAIRVMKGASSYNVYQDDAGDWARSEISSGIGCIAPRSVAHSAAGWYYLSNKGVILENDGPYIERTQATQLISAPLKNFDNLPMASKRNAVAQCVDNKYLLCIGDTTYVWDERAQGWSTWSIKFSGATLYGVDANINFVRPDTMYFTQPNSRTLFRYGSAERDNGSDFTATWQSQAFALDNWQKTLSALGVWVASINSGYDKSTIRIINEQADTLCTRVDTSFGGPSNLPTPRFSRMSLSNQTGLGFRIDLAIQRLTPNVTTNPIIIDGIDLYYQRQGKVGE